AGAGSLRQAAIDANAAAATDTVTFDPAFFATAKTITLTTGQIDLTDSVAVQGPGATLATVSGNNVNRIFNLSGSGTLAVSLAGLTLSNGSAGTGNGGAVLNDNEILTVTNCIITGNSANQGGGIRLENGGSLTLQSDILSSNNSTSNGAGISVGPSAT